MTLSTNASDIIALIVQAIFVILAIIFIIQLILKIIGMSPTEMQLLYVGFGSILGYLFFVTFKLGELSQRTRATTLNVEAIHRRLGLLEGEIRRQFGRVEKRLVKIENRL